MPPRFPIRELAQQILALQIRLSTLPANDAERIAINGNLELLQSEQAKRGTLGGAADQAIGEVPRPAGLPMDGGYALFIPPLMTCRIWPDLSPEGQIVTVGGDHHRDAAQPSRYTSPFAGASGATSAAVNAVTTTKDSQPPAKTP